jgi:glycosyltransferase involved in cell wall biosynthesis
MTTDKPPRATISVCIIAFNEEADIRECLESVKWADEVIVVDSFSADKTPALAKECGARVVQREWAGHVEQKNFALDQAKSDWILSIDADERVSPELAKEIQEILRVDCPQTGFSVPRRTWYLGRWIMHGGWYPGRKLRLVRRGRARWGGVNPHDHLYADGPTGALNGDLYHYTYRDITDHLKTIDRFTTISSRELDEQGYALPLAGMLFRPPARFLKMYLLRLGFLDGMAGFILAVLAGYYVFLKYAKLWEIRNVPKPK